MKQNLDFKDVLREDVGGHEVLVRCANNFLTKSEGEALISELQAQYQKKLFRPDEVRIGGKVVKTQREVAFFGTTGLIYAYGGTSHHHHEFTPILREICEKVGKECKIDFNSVGVNFYPLGSGCGQHSDNEEDIERDDPGSDHVTIATVSLGAKAGMEFTYLKGQRKGERRYYCLQSGSLLVMSKETQKGCHME